MIINKEIMEYLVWVIELTAGEFFGSNKVHAYKILKDHGILDLFVQSYDVTHTLGASCIIEEIREILLIKKVI
jgi:hypothetical protein